MREFVEHYKNLNFIKIYLIDNNDLDGERLDSVIKDYVDSKYVTVINARGKKVWQLKGYTNCYYDYGYKHEWILFVDLDEFLFINDKDKTITKLMNDSAFKECDSINFNWIMYGDNDLVYYDPRPLMQRFTKPFQKKVNVGSKTMVKSGLNFQFLNPHFMKNDIYCRIDGSKFKKLSEIDVADIHNFESLINIAHIKHFITKTAEEYVWKLSRGYPDQDEEATRKTVNGRVKMFFKFNKLTREKFEILKAVITDEKILNYYENLLKTEKIK